MQNTTAPATTRTTIHGVDLAAHPRGTAFQAELVDGTIFTGTWTGAIRFGHVVLRHVDTGQDRNLGEDSVRWIAPLADVRP